VVYVHVKAVFVTLYELIKGLILAIDIQLYQLLIALVLVDFHYFIFLVNNE